MDEQKLLEFAANILEQHNYYRELHNAPKLVLDEELNKRAIEWATELASKGRFEHRQNIEYGENLYQAQSTDPNWEVKPSDVVKSWYDEIQLYKFGEITPDNLSAVGHFTQLVWLETKSLGVGLAASETGQRIVVCNYEPAGNVIGKFAENVTPSANQEEDEEGELIIPKAPSVKDEKKVKLKDGEISEGRLRSRSKISIGGISEEGRSRPVHQLLSPEDLQAWVIELTKIGDIIKEWQQWLLSHINLALRIGECISKTYNVEVEEIKDDFDEHGIRRDESAEPTSRRTEQIYIEPESAEVEPLENLNTKTMRDIAEKDKDNFINVQYKMTAPSAAIDEGGENGDENSREQMKSAAEEWMHIETRLLKGDGEFDEKVEEIPIPTNQEEMLKLFREVVYEATVYRALYKQWMDTLEKKQKQIKQIMESIAFGEIPDTTDFIFTNLNINLESDVEINYEEFPLMHPALESMTYNNMLLYFNLTDKPEANIKDVGIRGQNLRCK